MFTSAIKNPKPEIQYAPIFSYVMLIFSEYVAMIIHVQKNFVHTKTYYYVHNNNNNINII